MLRFKSILVASMCMLRFDIQFNEIIMDSNMYG
jgi:hypothetical protein